VRGSVEIARERIDTGHIAPTILAQGRRLLARMLLVTNGV
jgi:hypothetical protein